MSNTINTDDAALDAASDNQSSQQYIGGILGISEYAMKKAISGGAKG